MAISYNLDKISYQIGMINCFVEMVAFGVKKLAISPPIDPEDLGIMTQVSKEISDGYKTKYYVENSLMITDIQSAEFTEGKNSILYYVDDSIINEYLSLKKRVDELTAKNVYAGAERREISIRFGELLGYPEKIILSKVDGIDHSDPFVLY
jgi:hypothetical protein